MAGKSLESEYTFKFTTEKASDDEGDFPIPLHLLLLLVLAIVAIVIIITLISAKKKKTTDISIGQQSQTIGSEPQLESPDTFQVQCSNCSNMLQVNDIGVTMNVTCPFCSTLLTVESQKTQEQMTPQPQSQSPQTITISCPHCQSAIQVTDLGVPMQVQCPICNASFVAQSKSENIKERAGQEKIKCPKCSQLFDVTLTQKPMRVKCPHCKTGGTLY
jgi:predicted Zn finger-like uncharacterized protein